MERFKLYLKGVKGETQNGYTLTLINVMGGFIRNWLVGVGVLRHTGDYKPLISNLESVFYTIGVVVSFFVYQTFYNGEVVSLTGFLSLFLIVFIINHFLLANPYLNFTYRDYTLYSCKGLLLEFRKQIDLCDSREKAVGHLEEIRAEFKATSARLEDGEDKLLSYHNTFASLLKAEDTLASTLADYRKEGLEVTATLSASMWENDKEVKALRKEIEEWLSSS